MAGLLDDPNASMTPMQMGLLGLGAGLLSGSYGHYGQFAPALGAGASGFMQGYQGAQENQIMDQYRKAQAQQLQQTADWNKMRQGMITNLLGLPGTANASPSATMSGPNALPTLSANISPESNTSTNPQASPSRQKAMAYDLLFNNGKGISNLVKPNIDFVNGVAVDKNAVTPGTSIPVISQNGQASQLIADPNAPGGYRVIAPQGAVDTYSQYQNVGERAKAVYDPAQYIGPGGNTYTTSRLGLIRAAANGNAPMTARNPADVQYDIDTAKATADQYKSIQTAGFNAPAKIANYQQLGNLLDKFDNGKLSASGTEIAQAAKKWGVLPSTFDDSLGNAQAVKAISNQMALQLRDPSQGGGMPGSLSDADRNFLTSMIPNLTTTPEGRRQMLGMAIGLQERNQQVANMARAWQKGAGRLDKPDRNGMTFFDYLQQWSARNPLFGDLNGNQ